MILPILLLLAGILIIVISVGMALDLVPALGNIRDVIVESVGTIFGTFLSKSQSAILCN